MVISEVLCISTATVFPKSLHLSSKVNLWHLLPFYCVDDSNNCHYTAMVTLDISCDSTAIVSTPLSLCSKGNIWHLLPFYCRDNFRCLAFYCDGNFECLVILLQWFQHLLAYPVKATSDISCHSTAMVPTSLGLSSKGHVWHLLSFDISNDVGHL